jgi:hypothetical protein
MDRVREETLDRYSHLDYEQRNTLSHATGIEGLAIVA